MDMFFAQKYNFMVLGHNCPINKCIEVKNIKNS